MNFTLDSLMCNIRRSNGPQKEGQYSLLAWHKSYDNINDGNDDSFIATLQLEPPGRVHPAKCTLPCGKEQNLDYEEDLISLCIVGGVQRKVQQFCKPFAATGNSKRNLYFQYGTLGLVYLAYILLSIGWHLLLDPDEDDKTLDDDDDNSFGYNYDTIFRLSILWVLCSSVIHRSEKAYFSSDLFLNSKRNFWKTWEQSGLETELVEILAANGYSIEINPNDLSWDISIRKIGTNQSLPAVTEYDEPIVALKNFEEVIKTNDEDNDDEQDVYEKMNIPIDMWTREGFWLGIRMRNKKNPMNNCERFFIAAFSIFIIAAVIIASTLYINIEGALVLYFLLLGVYFVILIVAIIIFRTIYECFNMKKLHTERRSVVDQFSPLVQARNGYSIKYDVRSVPNRRCCGWTRGVIQYVQKGQLCFH